MLWDLSRIPHAMATFSQPLHDLSRDCCWAGGQSPQISYIAPSLEMQLRFAQWQLASREDGSCWQAYRFLSSNPALGYWFWSAASPLFPRRSLPWYIASNRVRGFQDSLDCGCSQIGARDSHPQDRSQPARTGIRHPGLPQASVPALGQAGSAYVTKMPSLHPKLTTLVPLCSAKRCCHAQGLELCWASAKAAVQLVWRPTHCRLLPSCWK